MLERPRCWNRHDRGGGETVSGEEKQSAARRNPRSKTLTSGSGGLTSRDRWLLEAESRAAEEEFYRRRSSVEGMGGGVGLRRRVGRWSRAATASRAVVQGGDGNYGGGGVRSVKGLKMEEWIGTDIRG
ncbi:hypothetical protein E3N88_01168 [Mikania micrantha]|uniref:Uncharacterized protein n=1 Tax=Mikania micrantha TaxID=192012 RepID=A0A5N6Q0H4_9ASTR|nr:hypothetical protein E3N88_01168 [Mikania micrantha]